MLGSLAAEYLKLTLWSVTLALPIGYVISFHFLKAFAYRIELGAGIFWQSGLSIPHSVNGAAIHGQKKKRASKPQPTKSENIT